VDHDLNRPFDEVVDLFDGETGGDELIVMGDGGLLSKGRLTLDTLATGDSGASKTSMTSGLDVVWTSSSIALVMSSKTRWTWTVLGSANSELSGIGLGKVSTASLERALFLSAVFGELNLVIEGDALNSSFSALSGFGETPSRDLSLSTMSILSSF